ncbi:MAG TPA: hypothetical protein VMU57_06405, partial [Edaphobacter sp.]|uniref:hypothetical protein n=1 Tax=Edaphobacter sp. TaxID=1934404 RepID=UPI002BA72D64
TTLPEPWLSFLRELDPIAGEPTKIPCIGGFAVTQYYGSVRTTVDLDIIDVAPIASRNRLLEAGGKVKPMALRRVAIGSATSIRGNMFGKYRRNTSTISLCRVYGSGAASHRALRRAVWDIKARRPKPVL